MVLAASTNEEKCAIRSGSTSSMAMSIRTASNRFWAPLKRAHKGVYHKMGKKHLHRYANEFAGRHNLRDMDTIDQMKALVLGMELKRLTWRDC